MKKTTLLIVLICMAFFSNAQTVTTVWEQSRAAGNLPDLAAISAGTWSQSTAPAVAGTARKFAVGTMNSNERVFVLTRSGANGIVLIYKATDGTYVGKMQGNTSGGLVAIGDGDVTEDGKLIVSNVTAHNAAGEFKVYMWDAEDKSPTVLFTYATTNARYGDNLFVTGNYDNGTAKIYAAKKILGYSKVLCWSMEEDTDNPGTFKFNDTPTETINVFGTNTAANVCTSPTGGMYYKDAGYYGGSASQPTVIAEYYSNKDSINSTPANLVSAYGVAPRFVGTRGSDQILTYFKYYWHASLTQAPSGQEQDRAELLLVPNGDLSQATSIITTPSLGNEKNLNGWGDIVTQQIDENNIAVYVFSSYNGFGKYTIDLNAEPGGEEEPGDEEPEQVNTLWEYSNTKGNMHSGWSYRKIAIGDLGAGKRVYAAVGAGTIKAYKDEDGTYVRDLTGSVPKTALLAIGDLGMTEDGKLLVSNVSAHNADNTPFEVYMWSSEDSNPVKIVETRFNKQRFGDNIFVEGNYSTGTAKVYATRKIDYNTAYDVLCWSMEEDGENPGSYKFNNTPAATINVTGGAIQWANVSTFPEGIFYKDGGNLSNGNATRLQQFNNNGELVGEAPAGIVTRHSSIPNYIGKIGDDYFVALFRYYPTSGTTPAGEEECRAEIFRIPEGDISLIESIAMTPTLGNNSNFNGWGSLYSKISVNDNDENEAIIYVSSTTNGFGKYKVLLDWEKGPQVSTPKINDDIKIIKKSNQIIVEGVEDITIEIYNMLGQRTHHVNATTVNTSSLSGIYIVNIKQAGHLIKTHKFIF